MENDLEEGEVLDSENEEEGRNKTMLPLPDATNPENSFSWRTESSSAGLSSLSVAVVTSVGPGQQPVQRLRRDSCDSASSAEASDSDSDEAPFAKRRCPNSRPAASASHLPHGAARPQTKYNIWGSVLQEQTLANDLSGWVGMNTKVLSDRSVETYDYRNAKKSLANESTDEVDNDIADECEEPQTHSTDVDICDRETFGTSAIATFDSNDAGDSVRNQSEDKQLCRKRKHDVRSSDFNLRRLQTNSNVNRQSAKNRLSKRTYDKEKDRSHIRAGINDSATAVGEELVRVLVEPEHLKDTFVRVAETLGAEKALDLLYCTEDLEEAGGLMTLNGSRRRTPGGIYLFLVKDDASITREQKDFIFGSTEERRKQQREAKRHRWRHHQDNIDAARSHLVDTILRPLPDRCQLLLDSLSNGKAEPSSRAAADDNSDMCDDSAAGDAEIGDDVDDVDDDALRIELDLV